MARPGLKQPPTHAVVVRGGDAPVTEEIPVARASFLPPPPPSDPQALALREKDTLRAIPRRSAPPPDLTPVPPAVMPPVAAAASMRPAAAVLDSLRPVMESLPPPSDGPVAAGSGDVGSPRSRPSHQSRWTIVAAAAAGLVLGMASIATTMSVRSPAPAAAAPPAMVVVEAPPAVAPNQLKSAGLTPTASSRPATAAAPSVNPARAPEPVRAPVKPKQTIF